MTLLRSLVNGIETDAISIQDRGLLYGHSLFETITVSNGQPLLLEAHLQRLKQGAEHLSIPFEQTDIEQDILCLCKSIHRAVLRVCLTIGEGGRGYLSPTAPQATRIISLYEPPSYSENYWKNGITVGYSDIKLATQPILAGIKHANRLEQVLARSQWHDDWQEALLCNHHGQVIEGTMSNLFAFDNNTLYTPPVLECGVQGVMRDQILYIASQLGIATKIKPIEKQDLASANELFLSNSIIGIWPIKQLEGRTFNDFSISHKLLDTLIQNESISIS